METADQQQSPGFTAAVGGADVLRAAFEELPASVWVLEGAELVVTGANLRARESAADDAALADDADGARLFGRKLADLGLDTIDEELLARFRDAFTKRTTVVVPDHVVRTATDGTASGPRHVTCTVIPWRGPDDQVCGVVVHLVETTADGGAPPAPPEHQVVLALQHTLLPSRLPSAPGLDVAARYLPGTDATGGDWYDVIGLPGGRLVVVVGDVVSGGRPAAAAMAQLRGALTAYAMDRHPPGEVLRRLSRYAADVPGARGTTICYAEVDPSAGTLRVASAGHPPPLLVHPGGEPRYLELPSGPPLGTGTGAPTEQVFPFGEGTELVLYSDGAVERRDRPVGDSMKRFAAQVGRSSRTAGALALCDDLEDWLRSSSANEDDVALLVVARTGSAPSPLRHVMPARAGQLPHARRVLDAWLDSVGMLDDDVISVQLAAGEAAANAVEHAYPPGEDADPDRLVEITAEVESGGVVRVVIADHGRWRPPSEDSDSRGPGLTLMRQ